jgi:pSer/pThr/pTyr-binding forkhead associated (FHA) protein
MNICPACSFKNEPTTSLCAKCGEPLPHVGDHPTERQHLAWKLRPRTSWGDIRLAPDTLLVLYVAATSEPLILPRQEQILIGRAGASGLRQPHVDLTPYEAVEYGVSRLHASLDIQNEAVLITDLRSTNGTYLNGLQLSPGQSKIVCNGDELCFGNLLVSIYFRDQKKQG